MAWCSSESDLEATLAKAIGYRSFESSYVNSPTSAYFTFSKINNCAGFDEIAGWDIALIKSHRVFLSNVPRGSTLLNNR